jgi:fructose-1,6-bisphosphatase/inositol monophosphatase family enzyme
MSFRHARQGAFSTMSRSPQRQEHARGRFSSQAAASSEEDLEAVAEVKTKWVNSVAYRLALVAAAAPATISLSNKSEWDLAAAALLVEEAGGIVTDHRGGAHHYNRPSPRFPSLVASGKALHPLLIERTRRVDL